MFTILQKHFRHTVYVRTVPPHTCTLLQSQGHQEARWEGPSASVQQNGRTRQAGHFPAPW